jgi:hypothetical protein
MTLYVGWGVMHLIAARGIYEFASSIPDGLVHARLEQGGLDLALFAVQAMGVAVLLNWRNDRIGYWLNIIVVGAVDLGYIVLVDRAGSRPRIAHCFRGPDHLRDRRDVFDRWFAAPKFGDFEPIGLNRFCATASVFDKPRWRWLPREKIRGEEVYEHSEFGSEMPARRP